jgi:hypothetical protein
LNADGVMMPVYAGTQGVAELPIVPAAPTRPVLV